LVPLLNWVCAIPSAGTACPGRGDTANGGLTEPAATAVVFAGMSSAGRTAGKSWMSLFIRANESFIAICTNGRSNNPQGRRMRTENSSMSILPSLSTSASAQIFSSFGVASLEPSRTCFILSPRVGSKGGVTQVSTASGHTGCKAIDRSECSKNVRVLGPLGSRYLQARGPCCCCRGSRRRRHRTGCRKRCLLSSHRLRHHDRTCTLLTKRLIPSPSPSRHRGSDTVLPCLSRQAHQVGKRRPVKRLGIQRVALCPHLQTGECQALHARHTLASTASGRLLAVRSKFTTALASTRPSRSVSSAVNCASRSLHWGQPKRSLTHAHNSTIRSRQKKIFILFSFHREGTFPVRMR